jgi:hypothetical protein
MDPCIVVWLSRNNQKDATLKNVEPSMNGGIINSITRLHLVGYFYWGVPRILSFFFSKTYFCTLGYTIHKRSKGTINIKCYFRVQSYMTFWKEHEKNFRLSKVKTSARGVDISIYFLRLANWVMSSRCQTVLAREPAVFVEYYKLFITQEAISIEPPSNLGQAIP